MTRCLLALGSNLGDRQGNMEQACAQVANLQGCRLLARSRWHETVPIGGEAGQGAFLNGALLLDCSLEPSKLINALQQIETHLGRKRVVRWDARTLDIDLLLFGQQCIEATGLSVPHPRMGFRKFVLEPAVEIAGAMLHPTSGWTLAALLAHLRHSGRLVVVTANTPDLAERVISHLGESLGCRKWRSAENCLPGPDSLPAATRVECISLPPLLVELSPESLQTACQMLLVRSDLLRPALVIAIDPSKPILKSGTTDWLKLQGLGPVARIKSADFTTQAQEAEAALRCVWPDLQ